MYFLNSLFDIYLRILFLWKYTAPVNNIPDDSQIINISSKSLKQKEFVYLYAVDAKYSDTGDFLLYNK